VKRKKEPGNLVENVKKIAKNSGFFVQIIRNCKYFGKMLAFWG